MSFSSSKVRLFHGLKGAAALGAAALALVLVFSAPVSAAVDFDALKQEAPDAVAWIRLDSTTLNYPVVQGTDNEFYLTRLPNGEDSDNGSIFMDYRNTADFSDQNTLIHGHRMRSGAMFGTLKNYMLQEYYDAHPTLWIYTPQGDYEVALFACYTFDQTEETFPLRFADAETFDEYIRTVRERSTFTSDVEVNYGDFLVTLLTCDYDYTDGRLILMGKLLK